MLTGKIEGKRARGRQRSRPDCFLRYRRYINHLLTYLLTYLLTFLGWLERSTGIKPLDLITRLQKRQENDVVAAVNARILAWHLDWIHLWRFFGLLSTYVSLWKTEKHWEHAFWPHIFIV